MKIRISPQKHLIYTSFTPCAAERKIRPHKYEFITRRYKSREKLQQTALSGIDTIRFAKWKTTKR